MSGLWFFLFGDRFFLEVGAGDLSDSELRRLIDGLRETRRDDFFGEARRSRERSGDFRREYGLPLLRRGLNFNY